eukprot:gnl/TRDRNA2_/TRDRNA2_175268_c0_seq4.p1 gnl/TRDRNA2_/TRDRNA2_175268_c0~~gnl/TRDRNA2_/TRDRNA2_175268_c0_seq4.p1  ORF type:complete len:245 (-),score=17.89 gnl/TRDRNA2_/TRDRNA2_175268_c0_seq4:155-802(-)
MPLILANVFAAVTTFVHSRKPEWVRVERGRILKRTIKTGLHAPDGSEYPEAFRQIDTEGTVNTDHRSVSRKISSSPSTRQQRSFLSWGRNPSTQTKSTSEISEVKAFPSTNVSSSPSTRHQRSFLSWGRSVSTRTTTTSENSEVEESPSTNASNPGGPKDEDVIDSQQDVPPVTLGTEGIVQNIKAVRVDSRQEKLSGVLLDLVPVSEVTETVFI